MYDKIHHKKKKVNEKALGEKSGCPGILHLDISAYFPPRPPSLFWFHNNPLCRGKKKKKMRSQRLILEAKFKLVREEMDENKG